MGLKLSLRFGLATARPLARYFASPHGGQGRRRGWKAVKSSAHQANTFDVAPAAGLVGSCRTQLDNVGTQPGSIQYARAVMCTISPRRAKRTPVIARSDRAGSVTEPELPAPALPSVR